MVADVYPWRAGGKQGGPADAWPSGTPSAKQRKAEYPKQMMMIRDSVHSREVECERPPTLNVSLACLPFARPFLFSVLPLSSHPATLLIS